MKKLIALISCILVFTVASEARTVSIVESENPGKDENLVTKPFETADNLRLFDVGGWSANGGILNGCIKDFVLQHAEGSVTNDVMRLVPVYDAESKKYGMFDEVRGKFLLNAASTGAFSADGAGETGARAYPAYKCSGVSKLVSGGVGLMVIVK